MATFKPFAGLGMTVVLLGVAGAHLGFLFRVGASAQPVKPGRVGGTGDIPRAEVPLPEEPLRSARPDLDDTSSSGTTTAPTSEQ